MFWKKATFNDEQKSEFVSAISEMLQIQMIVSGSSIEDAKGQIYRKAIGYVYGFIDGALTSIGQNMGDVSIGVPILFQVMRNLFPGRQQIYTHFLIDHVANDPTVMLGVLAGGQQYADFTKPDVKGSPMGLARFILEANEQGATCGNAER